METLLFLLTFLSLLILLIRLIINALRHNPVKSTLKIMGIIGGGYLILWTAFYIKSSFITVPLGTDVCFDDWCATVTKIETGVAAQTKLPPLSTDSTWVILHLKMTNQARGIAQKPSEPRVHLIDDNGDYWAYSAKGQQALEKIAGKQPGIDSRLELHQSLETQLVYAIPSNAKKVKALIEEGPFITKLLFADDQDVFEVR
jgi:hypothetical protein